MVSPMLKSHLPRLSKKHSSFCLLYFFILIPAISQTPKEQLQLAVSDIKSIKSNFVQTKHYRFLNNDMVTTGTFYYSKPAKMKWHQKSPTEYSLILNDGIIQIEDGVKQKQVDSGKNKIGFKMNKLILSLINGSILNDPNFHIEIANEIDQIIVQLIGKVKAQNFEKITLTFAQKSFYLLSMKIDEGQGDYSLIEFRDHKINTNISKEEFDIN